MRAPTLALSFLFFSLMAAEGAPLPPRAPASGDNSPYSAKTVEGFVQACKSDQSSCSAMIGEVLMDRLQFSPTSHICLSGVSYADKVVPWLAGHPQVAEMPVRNGIYLAITDLYKCGPPHNY